MLAHVVHAQDRRAAVVRRDGGADRRRRGPDPRPRRRGASPRSSCARGRSGSAGRSRRARRVGATSSKLCAAVFPKPMPGSRQTSSSRLPAATANASRSSRNALHVGDDVVVDRVVLHRPRLALHVHEAEVAAGVGDDTRELRVAAQRGDVVHELDAELERAPRDRRLRGVDRDRRAARSASTGSTRRSSSSALTPSSRAASTRRRRRRSPRPRRASPTPS